MAVTCSVCEKSFCKNSILNRHVREKHGNDKDSTEGKQVQCALCSRKFKRKDHLKTHLDAVHLTGKTIKCSLCHYSTVHKYTLNRHMKQMHKNGKILVEDTIQRHDCFLCDKRFKLKKHLNYHLKKTHNCIRIVPLKQKKCPLCPFLSASPDSNKAKQAIYDHFEEVHQTPVEVNRLEFSSKSEFYIWKSKIEEETVSKFVRLDGRSNRILNFTCHRSGIFKSAGTGKRCPKIRGSTKINGYCPAAMKTTINSDGTVAVHFTNTHVGHGNDLNYIPLTREARQKIAVKIADKMPYEQIMREISSSVTNSHLKRVHLTTRKDIQNIERSLNLSCKTAKLVAKHSISEESDTVVPSELKMDGEKVSFENSINHGLSTQYVDSEDFIEDKEAFIGEFVDTLRGSITNTEELNEVRKHCKTIKPMLKSMKKFKTSPQ